LALPVAAFSELGEARLIAGADVTDLLGVRKWEQPEFASNMGVEIGDKPYGIPTTDETRLQSAPEFLDAFKGLPYYITTKMDGTSCTIYCKKGQVGVCGRNKEYKEDAESCSMWAYVYKRGIAEKLKTLGEDIAVQGEFCGAGIQKNRLKLMEPNVFVFDVIKLDEKGAERKAGLSELLRYCELLGMDPVPIEEKGDAFNYTLAELLEKARGKYPGGNDKEGVVIRTQEYGYSAEMDHKLSFKVLNNDFLKKEE
jgi:RNA ligase (TIGR02306 family)